MTESPPRLMDELRGFDSIVSWYGANRAEFRDAVAGLPFTFFPALPQDSSVHATDFYLEQVADDRALRVRRHPADSLRGRAGELRGDPSVLGQSA